MFEWVLVNIVSVNNLSRNQVRYLSYTFIRDTKHEQKGVDRQCLQMKILAINTETSIVDLKTFTFHQLENKLTKCGLKFLPFDNTYYLCVVYVN